MSKQKHNPEASQAVVIRYLRQDSNQNEIVKKVRGRSEAVKWVERLNKGEKEPKKYGYLWQWKDPQAAFDYDLEKLDDNVK